MSKLLSSLLMAAVVAGLTAAGGAAPARQKDAKKDAPKTETKADPKAAKGGTIEVNEGKDGKYRFVIRDADGKLLAMSGPTGFETKDAAVKALETLKSALPGAKMAEGKKDDKKADKKDDK